MVNGEPVCTPENEEEARGNGSYPSGAAAVARLHADPVFRAQPDGARGEVDALLASGESPARDCAAEAAALDQTDGSGGRTALLSYRHAFHAGNHADVLKHLVLVALLDHLTAKPKPLWVIDTHAGAGVYDLRRGFATQLAEYTTGIGRLWKEPGPMPALERYLSLVRKLNPNGRLTRYPGSPWLARTLTRADDRLWLYELHPADYAALGRNLQGKGVRVTQEDGLQALRGLLPPQPKRALVLIDPSYEVKSDYRQVAATLREALQRFPTGTYAVWYPLLEQPAAPELPGALRKLSRNWLDARLQVRKAGPGLYGSGMFVINPPYTLPETLEPALASLVRLLGQDEGAGQQLEWNIV